MERFRLGSEIEFEFDCRGKGSSDRPVLIRIGRRRGEEEEIHLSSNVSIQFVVSSDGRENWPGSVIGRARA